jgi:hypothetical protein
MQNHAKPSFFLKNAIEKMPKSKKPNKDSVRGVPPDDVLESLNQQVVLALKVHGNEIFSFDFSTKKARPKSMVCLLLMAGKMTLLI